MPFETLNAAPWAVNDPNGYILFPLVTKASADVNAPADSDKIAILYKDGGVGHFDATLGFTHIFAWQYTDTTGNGKCYMGYQDIPEDFRAAKNNGDPGTGCLFQSDGAGKVDINAFTDGSNTKSNGVTGALNELTTYYVKSIMTSTTYTIEFYPTLADAQAGTNMVTSDSITRGGNEPNAYRYVQIMGNENRGSTGREWGFDVWDVDLQEVTYQVTETFNDSTGTAVPDGTTVNAFDATTHKNVGSGTTTTGSVTINVSTSGNVYLVADPAALGGETVCTTAITPTAV